MAPIRDSVVDQQVEDDFGRIAGAVIDDFAGAARPRSVPRDSFGEVTAVRPDMARDSNSAGIADMIRGGTGQSFGKLNPG